METSKPRGGGADATWVPPGHFYSPIADVGDLWRRRETVFDRTRDCPEIDFYDDAQIDLVRRLSQHCKNLPFSEYAAAGRRYYYENGLFSYGDANILAGMMLELRPKRIIEIGSGFSSAVMMDVNEIYGCDIDIVFIEPYPKTLLSLMKPGDGDYYPLIDKKIYEVDLALFDKLNAGDFLFIDSTHVSKAGSDVNYEFFNLFPRLKPGVFIHLHDIFYPFEYPENWFFKENRSWNELYLLRAFLTHNDVYQIRLFSHYLFCRHRSVIEDAIPVTRRNRGGSFWMQKVL